MKYLTALALFAMVGCSTTQVVTRRTELPPRNSQFAEAMAAKEMVDALEERRNNGEALTPVFLEMQYTWSRRLCEAGQKNAANNEERIAAIRTHLQLMKKLQDIGMAIKPELPENQNIPIRILNAQTSFYVAEAELWLSEAGGK